MHSLQSLLRLVPHVWHLREACYILCDMQLRDKQKEDTRSD
jgi:hypothetical protein